MGRRRRQQEPPRREPQLVIEDEFGERRVRPDDASAGRPPFVMVGGIQYRAAKAFEAQGVAFKVGDPFPAGKVHVTPRTLRRMYNARYIAQYAA